MSFPLKEALRWSSLVSRPRARAHRAVRLQGLVDTSQGFGGLRVVLNPGWLKKHLTRNYSYESHWRNRWKHFGQISSAAVSNREISFLLLSVEKEQSVQLTGLWLLLCCGSRQCFFLILSIYNTHTESIARPDPSQGHQPNHFPCQLSRFRPSCSIELRGLDNL